MIAQHDLVEYMEANGWELAESQPHGWLYRHAATGTFCFLPGIEHSQEPPATPLAVMAVAQTEGISHTELIRRIHAMHAPDATIRALGCAWLLILAAIGYVAVGVVVGMLK